MLARVATIVTMTMTMTMTRAAHRAVAHYRLIPVAIMHKRAMYVPCVVLLHFSNLACVIRLIAQFFSGRNLPPGSPLTLAWLVGSRRRCAARVMQRH